MIKLREFLEKFIPEMGQIIVPSFITCCAVFGYLLFAEFLPETGHFFHISFYSLSAIIILLLLNINRSRPLMFVVTMIIVYCLINYLKFNFSLDDNIYFLNIKALFAFNLLVFYLLPSKCFNSNHTLLLLISFLIEFSIIELLSRHNIAIELNILGFNLFFILGFLSLMITSMILAIAHGKLYDYSVFFASICLCCGLIEAKSPSALSLFFASSALIMLFYLLYDVIYNHYYDSLTGLYNRHAYISQAKNFPLKYTLAIINLDDFKNIYSAIGNKYSKRIIILVSRILQNLTPDSTTYHYSKDRFVIIFKTMTPKETRQFLDEVRRSIAGLNFEYSASQQPLKLTISGAISEKKRSDLGVEEVFSRAEKKLEDVLKFNQNIISPPV